MRFLGIDIGYDRCGYCVLEQSDEEKNLKIISAGCITTSKSDEIYRRLRTLSIDLLQIRNKYAPEYVSIEKLFFHRKNMTFEKICMAKGIAMNIFADSQISEIEPKRMKKHIVGHGNATKSDIKSTLEKLLTMDLNKIYDDTLDALCLAMYHAELVKFENLYIKK